MKNSGRYKKKTLFLLIFTISVVAYLMIVCLPYSGELKISDEVKASLTAESFYSQTESKERVMLLNDPEKAFFHRINAIKKAENQILLSTFVFYQGSSSDILVGALLDAANRGVDVFIIVDKWSNISNSYKYCFINNPNVHYFVFNPLNIFKPQYINSSLHDKYLIVDNTYLIIGGRSVGDKYFVEGSKHFQYDMDVLIYNTDDNFKGSVSQGEEYYFGLTNASVSKRYDDISVKNRVMAISEEQRLLACFFSYNDTNLDNMDVDYNELTVSANKITLISNNLIESTKKEPVIAFALLNLANKSDNIAILSPYVVLTKSNFALFSDAVKNKNVTLITNSVASSNDRFSYSNYYINRKKHLSLGTNIYEFQGNDVTLHGKCYLFDDRLTVIGSFNLDERSIRVDTESMVVIDSRDLNALTKAAEQEYIDKCLQVNPETNKYYDKADLVHASVQWYKKALYISLGYILNLVKYLA